ncbi:hypothetical protein C8Q79DRAFT_932908 [Trametes meyenii]|nr:hypothetical protein C8Q79DRAFT_932908 [Trametes meyenii]
MRCFFYQLYLVLLLDSSLVIGSTQSSTYDWLSSTRRPKLDAMHTLTIKSRTCPLQVVRPRVRAQYTLERALAPCTLESAIVRSSAIY